MWLIVQHTLFAWSPWFMFAWRRWLLRCFGARIGKQVEVRPGVVVKFPWKLVMDDFSSMADRVTVYNLDWIKVGSRTVISQDTYLCAGTHDYTRPSFQLLLRPITIGSEVWLAAGVFVHPGICVGNGVVVGARSVVTKNLEPGKIYAGMPAKEIGLRQMSADVT
jgi:Acetyltransferase (isoleucine patch superfamily)